MVYNLIGTLHIIAANGQRSGKINWKSNQALSSVYHSGQSVSTVNLY